jgi:tetratricopeptide (TPR) repeat protein
MKTEPDEPGLIRGKANLYKLKGEFEQSESECRKLLARENDLEAQNEGYSCLADLYACMGRMREAIDAQEKQISIRIRQNEIGDLSDDYANLAYLYFWGRNDRDKADAALDQALQHFKDRTEITHALFDTLALMGRSEDALFVAKESLWGHRPFTTELEAVYQQMHTQNYQEAIRTLEKYKDRFHAFDRVFAEYSLAKCFFAVEKYDRAIETLQAIISVPITKTFWEYPQIIYLLGNAQEMNGDKQSAKQNYQKFLSLWKHADSDHPDVKEARKRLKSL